MSKNKKTKKVIKGKYALFYMFISGVVGMALFGFFASLTKWSLGIMYPLVFLISFISAFFVIIYLVASDRYDFHA